MTEDKISAAVAQQIALLDPYLLTHKPLLDSLAAHLGNTFHHGGRHFLVGSGPFGAVAGLIGQTFLHRQTMERPALPAIALTSDAGLATIPLMVFTTAGAFIGSISMRKMDRYRIPPLIGLASAAAAIAVMALFAASMSLWLLFAMTTIVAIGIGAIFSLIAVSLQSSVARHDLGTTMALLVFLRSLGQAIGVAVLGSILFGIAGADGIEEVGVRSPDAIRDLETAFRYMFAASSAGFALAFVFLWRMEDRPLEGYGRLRGQ